MSHEFPDPNEAHAVRRRVFLEDTQFRLCLDDSEIRFSSPLEMAAAKSLLRMLQGENQAADYAARLHANDFPTNALTPDRAQDWIDRWDAESEIRQQLKTPLLRAMTPARAVSQRAFLDGRITLNLVVEFGELAPDAGRSRAAVGGGRISDSRLDVREVESVLSLTKDADHQPERLDLGLKYFNPKLFVGLFHRLISRLFKGLSQARVSPIAKSAAVREDVQ